MAFRTKLDFSSNRQVKQHEKTITSLSGGTSFGLPYSAMTYGPDLNTSAITQTISILTGNTSTFSGNNTTTNFTWFDSRMDLGSSSLSAITPSNSATTQNTGIIFTPDTTTTIDGNLVNLTYSGVSFDMSPLTMVSLGGSDYSGTVVTYTLEALSASTLDFTGRTIWADVSGITRTERLIITNNPQVGYVWTCMDSEGMGEWQYNGTGSTSTIWTAGTGINSAVLGGSGGYANDYSVSEGFASQASGWTTHAEGYSTQAIGPQSHAEGDQSIASGTTSHAEGSGTLASGQSSHSEGAGTISSGQTAHAEGYNTIAGGYAAHAEGILTTASGAASHAEGRNTIASGIYSHSEGSYTIASGADTHAEGNHTTAIGQSAHAEGWYTTAQGDYSHAGGYTTLASGNYSFVHGLNSQATNTYTIVFGQNITGTSANTVYVPDLVIDGLTSTDPIATDSNGKIVAGTSDARLKQNILELNDSLNIIKNLRGVSFEYTLESNMGDGVRYGFIAQEVQQHVPNIVRNRAKGDGMLSLNYNEIVPILVEAVKELSSNITTSNNTHLETQTILAEDNNIELNYSGTPESAIGGGIRVLHALDVDSAAELITDSEGNFTTNNDFKPNSLTIPFYKPNSSEDINGNIGNITRDDEYLYIKCQDGWRRSNLERF